MLWFFTRIRFARFCVAAMIATAVCLASAQTADPDRAAFEFAKSLKRGINLGNFFDAPVEGYWGMTYDETLFDRIAEAGLTTVRIPTRWSNHTGVKTPYQIKPEFLERMESVIQAALKRKLIVVVDLHHYRQLNGEKVDEGEIFVDPSCGEV
jgi:endoglucanase